MTKHTAPLILEEDYRDCLQEITNVAMGQAADKLARLFNVFIVLPVPNINMLAPSELHMAVSSFHRDEQVTAVCQGFIGDGIAGEALLIFNDSTQDDIAGLSRKSHQNEHYPAIEAMMDTANVLIGACVAGIASQLEVRFSMGHPRVMGQHVNIADLIRVNADRWTETLTIEIHYAIEGTPITCDLLMLFTQESVPVIKQKADYLLG